MFGSGSAGSAQTPWRVHEREEKKGRLTEEKRWPAGLDPHARFMTDRRHCNQLVIYIAHSYIMLYYMLIAS